MDTERVDEKHSEAEGNDEKVIVMGDNEQGMVVDAATEVDSFNDEVEPQTETRIATTLEEYVSNFTFLRMEESDFTKAFKNAARISISKETIFYQWTSRKEGLRTITLTLVPQENETFKLDWRAVNEAWGVSTFKIYEANGIPGLLEDGTKFWKKSAQ